MKPVTYFWPAASGNADELCLPQGIPSSGLLNLNGSYAKGWTGFSRELTIRSTDDLSAENIIIVGTVSGKPYTHIMTGPNNGTKNTEKIFFERVTSIGVSSTAAAKNISVGLGNKGLTSPFSLSPWTENNSFFVDIRNLLTDSFQCNLSGFLDYENQDIIVDLGNVSVPNGNQTDGRDVSKNFFQNAGLLYCMIGFFEDRAISFKATFFQPGREQ